MPILQSSFRLARRPFGVSLALACVAGCTSPTSTDSLAVSLHPVGLATEGERIAWPSTPTIAGGPTIRVRGTAYVGCGSPQAGAERRGDLVRVTITAVDMNGPCPANRAAWVPFEAHVSGVAPRAYRVRVTVVGHEGHAEWAVTVTSS